MTLQIIFPNEIKKTNKTGCTLGVSLGFYVHLVHLVYNPRTGLDALLPLFFASFLA